MFKRRTTPSKPSTPSERRAATIELLTTHRVPFNPQLPLVEDVDEISLRSSVEVAERVICLLSAAAVAKGFDKAIAVPWLQSQGLWNKLSPMELGILDAPRPTGHQLVQMSWRCEAAMALLWALRLVKLDAFPQKESKTRNAFDVAPGPGEDAGDWIPHVELLPADDILNRLDLVYCQHWAIRQAQFDRLPTPGKLSASVIKEWHYALNWLTGYADNADWDEVTTDT